MLIIPVEQKLDGNNPPVATLLLILINCFIFFGYQAQDNAIWQKAYDTYESSELYAYEYDVYLDYLRETDDESYTEFKDYDEEQASLRMLSDIAFGRYLENDYFPNNVTALRWMDARKHLDSQVAELSFVKYGFIPGDLSGVTFITGMFLHGGFDHLFGNMLFLFIYGFSLEIALGRLWFVGIYLLSGICGNLLTWAVTPDSMIATVGASGAIFGLLGMYLGLYGLRKIKFFFTVGFYVNYFSAPALVLLPYWGLIELYQQFTVRDNVAHFVHLGGLISGALAVLLAKDRLIKINREYVEKTDGEDPFKAQYDKFLRYLETLNLPQAKKKLAELLQSHPHDFTLWKHQYDLWKLKPESPQYDLAAKAIFSQPELLADKASLFSRLVDEYEHLSPTKAAFDTETRTRIFDTAIQSDNLQIAERHLQPLLDEPTLQKKLPNMLSRLANRLAARNHHAKARQYREILCQRFPESEDARHARSIG